MLCMGASLAHPEPGKGGEPRAARAAWAVCSLLPRTPRERGVTDSLLRIRLFNSRLGRAVGLNVRLRKTCLFPPTLGEKTLILGDFLPKPVGPSGLNRASCEASFIQKTPLVTSCIRQPGRLQGPQMF